MIKLKISQTESISIDVEDIDYAEYRTKWGIKTPPAIQIFMKNGSVYKVEYADEFRPLIKKFKKYNIKFIY